MYKFLMNVIANLLLNLSHRTFSNVDVNKVHVCIQLLTVDCLYACCFLLNFPHFLFIDNFSKICVNIVSVFRRCHQKITA